MLKHSLLGLVLATSDATSAAGGNETDLGSWGLVAAHSGRGTNVLMVTTTVGMLDGLCVVGCGVAQRLERGR